MGLWFLNKRFYIHVLRCILKLPQGNNEINLSGLLNLHVVQIRSWPWIRHQGNQANQRFESIKLSVQQSPKVPFWNYVPHEKSGPQLVPFMKAQFLTNIADRKIMSRSRSHSHELVIFLLFYFCKPHNLGEKNNVSPARKDHFGRVPLLYHLFGWVVCIAISFHLISTWVCFWNNLAIMFTSDFERAASKSNTLQQSRSLNWQNTTRKIK